MMRRGDEYDGSIARDMESASGSYFSEEDVYDKPPEEERDVVRDAQ